MMKWIRSSVVDIKINPKPAESILIDPVKFIHDLLRSFPFFFRFKRDGSSVLIASTDEDYIPSRHSQKAHINVSGHINTSNMPDV